MQSYLTDAPPRTTFSRFFSTRTISLSRTVCGWISHQCRGWLCWRSDGSFAGHTRTGGGLRHVTRHAIHRNCPLHDDGTVKDYGGGLTMVWVAAYKLRTTSLGCKAD